jgi:type VI secretion system protein VasD
MKMAIIAGKFPLAALVASITLILAGCGLTQSVTDGTVAVTKSIFYKQIKTLHLDIRAREAVNSNAGGVALSTVVRIYQLKDRKTFDRRTTRRCSSLTVRLSKQTCWRRKISACSRAGR